MIHCDHMRKKIFLRHLRVTQMSGESPIGPDVGQVKVRVSALPVGFLNFLKCCTTFIHLFNNSCSLEAYCRACFFQEEESAVWWTR